jgi:hypothetical protein
LNVYDIRKEVMIGNRENEIQRNSNNEELVVLKNIREIKGNVKEN